MILRYLVAIPCFNNPKTVQAVVEQVLEMSEFPVLVVDDGSDQPVSELLTSVQCKAALESRRLVVLRHPQNLGKGAALQKAFAWALLQNKTHVISIDSDGQHLASEITKLVSVSRQNPWSLIIGSRRFKDNVPGVSKFGRKFSNFWVKYETGYEALDSQSGFRIYPMFYTQNIQCLTTKFDFEIEILIRLLWKKVDIREVDIEVYYPPKNERVSHFDKWRDNVRISLLNTILVIVSLLRGQTPPLRSAIAMGLGVFIGCTPFFGFHIFIAMAFAFLFRLNFLILFLGTNISVPWIAPFLAAGSVVLGRSVLGDSASLLPRLMVGSLVLGSVLGVLAGLVTYLVKKYFERRKTGWTGKTRGGVLGNGFLKLVLKYFGLKAGYFFLYLIVPYFYIFAPKARRSLDEYWSLISPDLNWRKRQRAILKHFLTFGKVLMDRVYQSFHQSLQFEISSEGPVGIQEVIRSQKGWVFIGAHVGGWDISTIFSQRSEQMARLGMVHFLADGLTFDKVIQRTSDARLKVDSIRHESGANSTMVVKDFLDNKKHVGFLADRAIATQVELIPFLGKLALFEVGPYRIAAACGAPMIFTYTFKLSDKKYLFISAQHSELKYNSLQARQIQVYRWAEEFAQDLEIKMRRFPDQWFNFYPFWSTRPLLLTSEKSSSTDNSLLEELSKPKVETLDPALSNRPSVDKK